jgi:hypothetical protein
MPKKKPTTQAPTPPPAQAAPVPSLESAAPTFGRVWGLGHFVMERP